MKRFIIIIAIIITGFEFLYAVPEKEIIPEIKHITIFPDRAQLTYESVFQIGTGETILRFTSLSPFLDPATISVKGDGKCTIMSVRHKINYLQESTGSPQLELLTENLAVLRQKIENEKANYSVLEEKKAFLVANRSVMSGNGSFSMEQFRGMMALYNSGMEELAVALLDKSRTIKVLEEEASLLQKQIDQSSNNGDQPVSEILVTVFAGNSSSTTMNLSYVTSGAGWFPSYDIRVDDINEPVSVVYKANISQSTNIDWENVLITLSNATPWVSGNVPSLNPWYIDFFNPVPLTRMAMARSTPMMETAAMKSYDVEDSAVAFVEMREGETTVNFDITKPYSIDSDGQSQIVEIQMTELEANFRYAVVPKISPHAYLIGEVAEWGKYGFQSGEATLYFEDSYVGSSTLQASNVVDTLILSMGVDNSIIVSREKSMEYTSRRVIGTNQTETRSFVISIRNNKSVPIEMEVSDQLPVSTNSEISVETVELSGGEINLSTGEVIWDLFLEPQELVSLEFVYSVKYPKGKNVVLD